MNFPLIPTMVTPALTDLTPEFLRQKQIRLLMLDFDNTIVPYTTNAPTEKMATWLREMQASAITLCVVSNSRKDRVKIFCKEYGIDCITHANKPFSKGIRQCLDKYRLPEENCALAGDQIYTDTACAKWCGAYAVLVHPIEFHRFVLRFRYWLEFPFRLKYRWKFMK